MKLVGTLIASAVLALGIGGVAHAKDSVSVPDAGVKEPEAGSAGAPESGTDVAKTAGCPIGGQAAADKPEYQAQCAQYPQKVLSSVSPTDGADDVTRYLCRVGDAAKKGFADNGAKEVAGAVGTVQGLGCKASPTDTGKCVSNCGGDDTCKTNCTSGGGTNPNAAVQARNETPDGSLPRTGGSAVLAGLGAGAMSLSSLIRRFLPRAV